MELENRAMEDMSAASAAAKANMPDTMPKSALRLASYPNGQFPSEDARFHAFTHQTMSVDRDIHGYSGQQPTLSADMRVHPLATQQLMSTVDAHSHPLPVPHQPFCPIAPPGQVMTDEQFETLRRQISVYATICQQLVEMHKAIMAQQGSASGLWLGPSIPFDPSLHSIGHKLTSRQRWTPSQTQLQILERLFEQETGTPNKQRIKEITIELSQHGQISETNVYNWFQNRRARTKRKQQVGTANNGDSELDTDADVPEEKRNKVEGEFTNRVLDATHHPTHKSSSGADNSDHHQGAPETSQRCVQSENHSTSFSRGHHDKPYMLDNKVWDVPFTMPESKPDLTPFPASQEYQGRQIIATGGESHS
ncbi:hypothetical protein KP509_34G018700 [Ceratopteris richardii]|uniref:Homeobox domain-containing protein n=1 Tax=Ceratopteris richardii TaxID=49495 RepID=A0A8T2QJT1_CERRI|nr:hypothetical protein KP509_34G018700 [Ceratopteris richardii]